MHQNNPPQKRDISKNIPIAKCATYGYPSKDWEIRVAKLCDVQENNFTSGKFSRNKSRTYCNRKFLKDALDFGCDIVSISPGRTIYPASTSIYYRVLNKKIWTVDAKTAFYLAQYGVFAGAVTPKDLIIGKQRYNHIAPIYPIEGEYDPLIGPTICQEGWYGGIFPISSRKAWGRVWKNERMLYFVLPLLKEQS